MSNLYEITGAYRALWSEVDNPDFDLDSLEDALNSVESELNQKCENVAKFIQNNKSQADQIDIAIKAMQHRKKVLLNKAESLSKYLYENMKAADIRKIPTPHFYISIAKNPKSVEIEDQDKIDSKFIVEKTTESPDKKAIKAAIESGETVEGAKLVQGESLMIK